MNKRLAGSLARLFEKHRVVFWYDAKKEMADEYAALELPDIEKVEIANNEFGIKYRILRQQPKTKFLLYHAGPQPPDQDNWLLDVLLAQGEFRADQQGLWLAELGLGQEFADLVAGHGEFFRSAKRIRQLKESLRAGDTAKAIRLKMLAVCAGAKAHPDSILEALLEELAAEEDDRLRLVERCGLAPFFWENLKNIYGYRAQNPTLQDFAIELFKCALGKSGQLATDAAVFMDDWKNNRKCGEDFKILSKRYAHALNINAVLDKTGIEDLLEADCFRAIDQKIITLLLSAIENETMTHDEIANIARKRRQSFWYDDFEPLYEAILNASQFFVMLRDICLDMENAAHGVEKYWQSWHRLDLLYRHFCANAISGDQAGIMAGLCEKMDKVYVNKFLYPLASNFQAVLPEEWRIPGILRMDKFFGTHVRPYLARNGKLCIIVSDALRYEAGMELRERIEADNRFSAEIEPMLSMLPSYTQAGMAALLPHAGLEFDSRNPQNILVDGMPSQGTENRNRIIQASCRGQAVKAEEILRMDNARLREMLKANDVCYIYHNRIDAVGDKLATENDAFRAVNDTLDELSRLIKKLTGNNVNNILLTADHGFLFQASVPDESDFASIDGNNDGELVRNRRFILGKNLEGQPGMRHFTSGQLGINGDIEALIPLGLGRIRVHGSGSRYVHGGATLQEVVIPLVKINKKRKDDTTFVSVDILDSTTSSITTNQLAVVFYQREAVTLKTRPRKLRAGIYSEKGDLVSSLHELIFDSASDNPRDRETTAVFTLTGASAACRGQTVILMLEEQIKDTNQFREYARRVYALRNAMELDEWD